MSDKAKKVKDGDILVPERLGKGTALSRPSVERMPARSPDNIVGSVVTRFVAGLRQKANTALAQDAHARADYFDAVSRVAKSYIGMNRAIDETLDLAEILALDRLERSANREEQRLEIGHRKEVAEQRRKQELLEAQRGAFNSEQGLENQQRLKQLNLETWEKRKEVEHLDAESLAAKLRGEAKPERVKRSLVEELQEQVEILEQEILEAEADGKDTGGDRMALAELRALIERLRGK